jgi:hypothetical protein
MTRTKPGFTSPAAARSFSVGTTINPTRGRSARSAAPSLDYSRSGGHDVEVAVSIGVLIEKFYGEIWNRWDDSAVDAILSPGFTFRGSLEQETSDRQGGGTASLHRHPYRVAAGTVGNATAVRICRGCLFTADERWLTSAWVLGDLDALRRQLS